MPVKFDTLFEKPKPLIAMIHTGPCPGVPGFLCMESAVERAAAEAEVYVRAGVDGILIENMHDFPCVHEREMGPEIAAYLTRVAYAVKRRARYTPVGLHVLFQANKTALAVAQAAGCDFVRAEGWTHAHVADKGLAKASAGEVIRYRNQIGANGLPIFVDVKKKHAAHALTADLTIGEMAEGMAMHQADAVVVSGRHTGIAPALDDLKAVADASDLPLLVGSGTTPDNVRTLYSHVDGFIVGSALKENGVWDAPVCSTRVERLVTALEQARAVDSAQLMKN